jgi:purine-nucleoside phosphorylase
MDRIQGAVEYIQSQLEIKPTIGLILGSGLGDLAEQIENPTIIPYGDIPYFPVSTVEGHKGQFVVGQLGKQKVIAMQGRFHYYEGYGMEDVVLPVRVLKKLGVEYLIVTNAAGAVNESFELGDLMIITDHINFMGDNPLIGKNLDTFGPRFPDMSEAYNQELVHKIETWGQELGMTMRKGVYCAMSGPTYETPAEVRMVRTLGADAVGMSTVPEVITAVHSGLKVMGISCMTNMASGILDQPLSHDEVVVTSQKVKEQFKQLIKKIVDNIE